MEPPAYYYPSTSRIEREREKDERETGEKEDKDRAQEPTHTMTQHTMCCTRSSQAELHFFFFINPHKPKHRAEAQVNGGHGVRGFLVFSAMTQHCIGRLEIGSPVCTSFSRCVRVSMCVLCAPQNILFNLFLDPTEYSMHNHMICTSICSSLYIYANAC